MDCTIQRRNGGLEASFKVHVIQNPEAIKTVNIDLYGSLTFTVERKIFNHTNSNCYNTTYLDIILIRTHNKDDKEDSIYKIKLSCPEFKIKEAIFYSDDSLWHVLNENKQISKYNFTLTLQFEPLTNIKFSVLYDDDQLTDFQLKAHDGEISIHKAFLATISAFFKSKLINDMDENVLYLDIPKTTVRTLVDFKKWLYLGILPDKDLEELLLLATYFKINFLEYKCIDKMLKNPSSEHVIKILQFAFNEKHIPLFLGIMDQVQCGNLKMNEIRLHYLKF